MPRRLTDKVLADLKPGGKPYEIADAGRTGLLVRVQPSGTKALYAMYKVHGASEELDTWGRKKAGPTRRVPLGSWPAQVSLAEARAAAVRMTTLARSGKDPEPEKTERRERVPTIKELVPAFLANGTNNKQGFGPRLENVVVPKWGKKTPGQLTRKAFQAELWRLVEVGEQPAARTLRDATRAFFSWVNERHHLNVENPAVLPNGSRLGQRLQEQKREFTPYTDAELRRFWAATANWGDKRRGMPGRFGLVARLALLTGHRSDKLTALCWSDIDDEVMRFPSPGRSRKRWAEVVPITPGIRAILDEAEKHGREDTDLVFWQRKNDRSFEGAKPSATVLRKRAGKGFDKTIMVLTRFRGHLNLIRGGVHDAKNKKALCT